MHVIKGDVVFCFIEGDHNGPAFVGAGRTVETPVAGVVHHRGHRGRFDETMTETLDRLDAQAKRLAPAFVMIDPFGVSGTPMAVVRRILSNPQAEVLCVVHV